MDSRAILGMGMGFYIGIMSGAPLKYLYGVHVLLFAVLERKVDPPRSRAGPPACLKDWEAAAYGCNKCSGSWILKLSEGEGIPNMRSISGALVIPKGSICRLCQGC